MHIVFLTHEYPKQGLNGGGIGSFVQFLSRYLVQNHIKVSVIGVNNSYNHEEEIDNGVTVYRLPKSKWKFGKFYQNISRILKKIEEIDKLEPIDIVEGSELNFAFFPKKTSYKKVIRLHGGHHFFAKELGSKTAFWRSFQEKRSFKIADSYVAVSDYVGRQTQKYLKYNFDYTVIYNSVDTEKFKKNENIKPKKNSILFVGTVCEKKGIRQLVQAMPIVKKKFPDVHLQIVGRDWLFPNGESYIKYLSTFIDESVREQIEIIGSVPYNEVPKYLSKAEISVFPSKMESFGLVILESLLMNNKVICSNIPPFKEIDPKDEVLNFCESISAKGIAKQLILILNQKEGTIGSMNRKFVENKFGVNIIVRQNIEYYNELIS